MKYAVITSKKDEAGKNIRECLLRLFDFKEEENHRALGNILLFETEEETIYCENIDKEINADILIFATKHQSKAGTKSLSVHIPGNFGNAEMGGKDKTLCIAPASLLKAMFLELNENGKELEGYEITLETVHHGPLLEKPAMFIEIGSSINEWGIKEAGEIIAKTIMSVLQKPIAECKAVIAIGGPHYPREYNKFLLRTEYAIGQMCPEYQLPNLDEAMLRQMLEKNVEKIEFVLLDWKGLKAHKEIVKELLANLNIPYRKVQEF
ncbi:MAG: D-aminoacyl-tRNA deacylase [Candidatus Nanoarchaeia archaeon]|nr:D-aminoacyl-tRNA deacylase [Candidatus Nanoarchaeia archaeon]